MNQGDTEKDEEPRRGMREQAIPGADTSTSDAAQRRVEEFSRLIVENGEDLFAVLDLDGRRLYNSPSYAKLFGDAESMKGSDSFAEIHADDLEMVKRALTETVAPAPGCPSWPRWRRRCASPSGSA